MKSTCDNCKHCKDKVCEIYGYYIIHPKGSCVDHEEDM